MQHVFPVYTQEKECHDCYKCVRQCPVKAIRVVNERAYIVPERCVACGRCVRVCPSGAKQVRNDLGRARYLLLQNTPVYASVAPSWTAVHPEWSEGQLIAALRRLGFKGVSETALGAQEVSAVVAKELADADPGLYVSSACPAMVDLIRKHFPERIGSISTAASPALTHCGMLRKTLGDDIAIIFIGPCAAKKTEADENPELMNLALTFAELDLWLADNGVVPAMLNPRAEDVFLLGPAEEGGVYPLEGGMIETLRHYGCPGHIQAQSISGLQRLKVSLERAEPERFAAPFFLEGLACRGGCVNGPCSTDDPPPLEGIIAVRNRVKFGPAGRVETLRVERDYMPMASPAPKWQEAEIREALASVGKTNPDDEINCGGCGYDTCRNFARALLSGDAETTMCAYYMRTIAQRKANALFRCIPSGVFIVGTDLRIVESNEAFAGIFGDEYLKLYEANPGLVGVDVENIFPCGNLLRAALRSGEEIRKERFKVGDKLLDIVIFNIETHKTVGAIVEDVTLNEMRRDQIARRAREVIKLNIATVQEIAARLGEHMADTEILLSSIAEGFSEDS
ncbi:MAG: 4Fe-4S binding protein [Planctomycetes bacterium]|nr:4Fe-4S binding protein [Planctomycetota bacterium]